MNRVKSSARRAKFDTTCNPPRYRTLKFAGQEKWRPTREVSLASGGMRSGAGLRARAVPGRPASTFLSVGPTSGGVRSPPHKRCSGAAETLARHFVHVPDTPLFDVVRWPSSRRTAARPRDRRGRVSVRGRPAHLALTPPTPTDLAPTHLQGVVTSARRRVAAAEAATAARSSVSPRRSAAGLSDVSVWC